MTQIRISTSEIPLTDSNCDIFRIIDAAANRTREGIRVIEDFVRFVRNDGHLSENLKQHRHRFATITAHFSESSLLASRDTPNDVGTTIGLPSEYVRTSEADVVRAAFKRVQEALRTLEEYSKVVQPNLAPQFEQLRYQIYTTEKNVLRQEIVANKIREQSVYLLVTGEQCNLGLEATVKKVLDAGIRLIQMREKSMSDRELLEHAHQLREWTSTAGSQLIINDRPDIAVLCNADGVHVGQDELTVQDARRIVGPDRLIGVSTHSIEQARQAVIDGADYIGAGPTFPSRTKNFEEFPGLKLVSDVASEIQLPWFAIGGIDETNVSQVRHAGATRVAVSSVICRSPLPEDAARNLLSIMEQSK